MMLFALLILVYYGYHAESQPPNPRIPIRVPPIILDSSSSSDSICPAQSSNDLIDKEMRKTRDIINSNYQLRPCKCGGPGWTRVINLNMADSGNTMCPANWTLITTPIRGCGRRATVLGVCDSVTYSVHGRSYSSVCGRILAYQRGAAGAFYNAIYSNFDTIEEAYLSGVSLTHGPAGLRKHIWSFVGAYYEKNRYYRTDENCPCTNTTVSWPHQVPPFINNDYFCDTGNSGHWTRDTTYFTSDPLWDGEGCGSTSTCCEFNAPPWFCKSLPLPTSDDLEIRNCYGFSSKQADKPITLIDVYVK